MLKKITSIDFYKLPFSIIFLFFLSHYFFHHLSNTHKKHTLGKSDIFYLSTFFFFFINTNYLFIYHYKSIINFYHFTFLSAAKYT